MIKVIDVQTMRRSDKHTIDNIVDSRTLMYRAGKGIYDSWEWKNKTAIICGSGNNAGDGYVVASMLARDGHDCTIIRLDDRFSEDGRYYYEKCKESNIESIKWENDIDLTKYDNILDCILGTGFKGEVRDNIAQVIDAINNSGAKVISADINSGLNGDNGLAYKAVKSNMTVSIGYFKPGHFLGDAKKYIHIVKNCNIGIEIQGKYLELVGDIKNDKVDEDGIELNYYSAAYIDEQGNIVLDHQKNQ